MKSIPLLLLCGGLSAQSLQILPSPPTGGSSGEFRIMMAAPTGKVVASLQWRIVPPDGLTISTDAIRAAPAVDDAAKSLVCGEPSTSGSAPGAVVCVVAGGGNAILNGAVAIIPFTVAAGSENFVVRLDRGLGATPSGEPVWFPDTTGAVAGIAPRPGQTKK